MTFKRLFTYLKPYKKSLYLVIAIVALSSLCTIFTPKLIGNIISSLHNSVETNSKINTKYIYTLIVTIACFYLINSLASYLENLIMNNACQNALNKLKNETYEKLSKLKMSYYDTHPKGDIISRMNNDIETISSLFLQTIPRIASYTITFIGTVIIMFTISIKLTLITIIALPSTIITSKFILKLSKKKYKEYYQKYGHLNTLTNESYTCKEVISLYNNDTAIVNNFKTCNQDLAKTSLKASLITGFITPISSLINYSVYLIVIILGAKYVLEKKLLLGDIQSLIQYTKQLSNPINSFSSLLASIQTSLIASKRVFEILDEKEDEHNGHKILNEIESIEFKNVSFSYTDSPLIENLNLKINKGEVVAIVGETGSGKSTIINLLMQFYKIKNGEILINNESIYNYSLNSYYDNISLIPQEPYLFTDTIENNLKYANTEANEKELENICKITNSFEIIEKSPLKFKEYLKEDENNLSEGEKQLLIISRALLKKHNLLILDEATSNIDSKNEQLIQNALDKTSKNRTTIIIAHKISTILKADKIIVMKEGKIIEQGNHHTLYNEKGEYYNFLQAL